MPRNRVCNAFPRFPNAIPLSYLQSKDCSLYFFDFLGRKLLSGGLFGSGWRAFFRSFAMYDKDLVASAWQKLSRLSTMSAAEVGTRLAQRAHQQNDWVRHRLGWSRLDVSHFSAVRPTGNFFVEPEQRKGRANLIQSALFVEADGIRREADQICAHRFDLLGYPQVDYGIEIDWHLDAVHQKRAPLIAWFKIPFLEFSQVGDHKVIWELNRHQHLVTLAKAALLTGDPRYSEEIIRQWNHWHASNPYPLGINWASSLEVAFRALSWIWLDHLMPESEATGNFKRALRTELMFHGRYIERFLSTYFSPNTHLLGEVVTLFFLGTLYSGVPETRGWRTRGWNSILHEAQRQVLPDGVYFEQSLYYHVYALDFFLHARWLAQLNRFAASAELDDKLNRMLDLVQTLAQPGPPEGFGDDDGGRLFHPRRHQTEHLTDPLAVGSLIYGRDDLWAARLTEESIWLFGEQAVTRLSHDSDKTHEVRSKAFADSGIYVMAGTHPVPHQIVIDAGPQGVGRCGHGHADALSVRFTGGGRRWLVDSGSGVYVDPDRRTRNYFRGTAAHNTLCVDGQDQAIADDAFGWTAIPNSRMERWVSGSEFRYFSGSHDGYSRLSDPVTHRRSVFVLEDGLSFIRDSATGQAAHNLELNWHFAPGIQLTQEESRVVARADDSGGIALRTASAFPWKHELLDARYSPAYGRFETRQCLRVHAQVNLPVEIGTLLKLEAGDEKREDGSFEMQSNGSVSTYQLTSADDVRAFCFSLGGGSWQAGPWSSDAEFLYWQVLGSRLSRLVLISGTRLRFRDEMIFESSQSTNWFEWSEKRGVISSSAKARPAVNIRKDCEFDGIHTEARKPAGYAGQP